MFGEKQKYERMLVTEKENKNQKKKYNANKQINNENRLLVRGSYNLCFFFSSFIRLNLLSEWILFAFLLTLFGWKFHNKMNNGLGTHFQYFCNICDYAKNLQRNTSPNSSNLIYEACERSFNAYSFLKET